MRYPATEYMKVAGPGRAALLGTLGTLGGAVGGNIVGNLVGHHLGLNYGDHLQGEMIDNSLSHAAAVPTIDNPPYPFTNQWAWHGVGPEGVVAAPEIGAEAGRQVGSLFGTAGGALMGGGLGAYLGARSEKDKQPV